MAGAIMAEGGDVEEMRASVHLHWDLSPITGPAQLPLQTFVGSVVGAQWDDRRTDLPHSHPTRCPFPSASVAIQVCPPVLQQQSTGWDLSLFATVKIRGWHELVL